MHHYEASNISYAKHGICTDTALLTVVVRLLTSDSASALPGIL